MSVNIRLYAVTVAVVVFIFLGAVSYMSINSVNAAEYEKSLCQRGENGEGLLDKEATSYDDIFDAFRMSLQFYQ